MVLVPQQLLDPVHYTFNCQKNLTGPFKALLLTPSKFQGNLNLYLGQYIEKEHWEIKTGADQLQDVME